MIAAAIWEYPAILAGVLIALGSISKFMHTIYKTVKTLDEHMDYVRHEMQLNSGKTMRDAIDRIEARQVVIEAHLKQQDATSAARHEGEE